MGTINRPTKSTGGQDVETDAFILASEWNDEIDAIVNVVNGDLEDVNLSASADVALTKLADDSDSASDMKTTVSPGSSGSEALPTDLRGELRRLRYAVERLALGVGAGRNDGSSTTAGWYDTPHRSGNLLFNASFEVHTEGSPNAPDGWTLIGTPSSVTQSDTGSLDGSGKQIGIAASSASVEGIEQTLSGLKSNTLYLVVGRISSPDTMAHLKTSGANSSGDFRDVDLTAGSKDTVKGIFQTDGSGSDVTIQFTTNGGASNTVFADHLAVYECNPDPVPRPSSVPVQATADSEQSLTAGAGFTDLTDLEAAVTVPSPGCWIEVWGVVTGTAGGSSSRLDVDLQENGSTVAGPVSDSAAEQGSVSIAFVQSSPTVGNTYTYKLRGSAVNNNVTVNGNDTESSLVVILRGPGS